MESPADQAATSSHDGVSSRPKKKWHIKVRTGCDTCKRRRVKCDERKPTCERCANSHQICEGYASVPKPFMFVPSKQWTALSKSKKMDGIAKNVTDHESATHEEHESEDNAHYFGSALAIVPGTPYKDINEQAALKYWLHVVRATGFQQPKNPLADLFATHMPQAAWSHDSVRHGLLAAASSVAAHEYYHSSNSNDVSQALAYSIKQKRQAMLALIKETSSPEVSVLTALIIYITESWSGRMLEADLHLAAAQRITQEARRNASRGNTKASNETFDLFAAFIDSLPDFSRFDATVSDTAKLMRLTETELSGLRRHYVVLTFVRAQAWMNRTIKGLQDMINGDVDTKGLAALLMLHKQAIRRILEKWSQIPLDSDRTRYAANAIEQELVFAEEYPYSAIEKLVVEFLSENSAISLAFVEVRLVVALRASLLYAAQYNALLLEDAAAVAHYIDNPR